MPNISLLELWNMCLIWKLVEKHFFECWSVNPDSAKLTFPTSLWQNCWPANSRPVCICKPVLYLNTDMYFCSYGMSHPFLLQNPNPKKESTSSALLWNVLKLSLLFLLLQALLYLQVIIAVPFPFLLANEGLSGQYL